MGVSNGVNKSSPIARNMALSGVRVLDLTQYIAGPAQHGCWPNSVQR